MPDAGNDRIVPDDLKAAIDVPVWTIGDCVRVRQIGDSVREGWLAAMEII